MRYYMLYDEEASQGYSENNPKPQMNFTDWVLWIIILIVLVLNIIVKIEDWINEKKTRKKR